MSEKTENASQAARELSNCRPLRVVTCVECGTAFTARDTRARFCSNACKQRDKYRRAKARHQRQP